jgi:hypothetical protein
MGTYEQLRDAATGDGADAWREADRESNRLIETYESLRNDPRYTQEHKAERAWAAYDAAAGKIAANRAKARESFLKRSLTNERLSIPLPHEEVLNPSDTNKLLASQNEAQRVVRKLDRLEASAKGPFKPDRVTVLREEYGRGLEAGSVQGGAICRGVLDAADELGVSRHEVVDGFRKDRHRESLEHAERFARLADVIGGKAPEPPFARPGTGRGSDFHTGRAGTLLASDRQPSAGAAPRTKRRPAWK